MGIQHICQMFSIGIKLFMKNCVLYLSQMFVICIGIFNKWKAIFTTYIKCLILVLDHVLKEKLKQEKEKNAVAKLGLEPRIFPMLVGCSSNWATMPPIKPSMLHSSLTFFQFNYPESKPSGSIMGPTCWLTTSQGHKPPNVTGKGKNAVTKLELKIGTFPILAGRSTNWVTGPLFKPCPLQRGIQHIHVRQMFDVGNRVFMKWKAIFNTYVKCLIYMY